MHIQNMLDHTIKYSMKYKWIVLDEKEGLQANMIVL